MKKYFIIFIICCMVSCDEVFEIQPDQDLVNPSTNFLENATSETLQGLVYGLESRHADVFRSGWLILGTFGREMYFYNNSDPRWIEEWTGSGSGTMNTGSTFFLGTNLYDIPYRTIDHANALISAVGNSSSIESGAVLNGYLGVAKTIQAYQYLYPLLTQFDLGIRIDVNDPLNPGPYVEFDQALAAIRSLLDEGADHLRNAGNDFDFALTSGYAGFDTPSGFLTINRAIAARAAIYAEDWEGALNLLNDSFLDLSTGEESMYLGPVIPYTNDGQNPTNAFFTARNTGNPSSTTIVAHEGLINDAESGDLRVSNKMATRDVPATHPEIPTDGITEDIRFEPDDDLPWFRNEELILIYAEANAQLGNFDESTTAINLIRSTWGLADFTNPNNNEQLIDQILVERRYSLWNEGGHRWIDMRRYDRLNEIDLSRDNGIIFTRIERPQDEVDFDLLGG